MIDYLVGHVVHMEDSYFVLEVQQVGYRIFCANPYAFQWGTKQTVYIHHHVREDAITLYGFKSRQEQALFRKLIEVSGIGPRVANGIMSGADPTVIVESIQHEDINFLITLPGIGRKTAQRIILDLKDKLDDIDLSAHDRGEPFDKQGQVGADQDETGQAGTAGQVGTAVQEVSAGKAASTKQPRAAGQKGQVEQLSPASTRINMWLEAKEGLLTLGYTEAELAQCWNSIRNKVKPEHSVDDMMKLALQTLFKG